MRRIRGVLCFILILVFLAPASQVKAAAITKQELFQGLNPQLVVSSYSIEEGAAFPGETITIRLTLTNTNEYSIAYNILLSYTSNNAIYPVYGESNQVYIEKLEMGDSTDIDLSLVIDPEYDSSAAQIYFSMGYSNIGGSTFSNSSSIFLPIQSIDEIGEITIDNVTLTNKVTYGDAAQLYIAYENTGNVDATNVLLTLSGNIAEDKKEIELADLKTGASNFLNYDVVFQDTGEQELSIALTFEDENGNKYSVDGGTYSANVTTASQSNSSLTPTPTIDEGTAIVTETSRKLEAWMLLVAAGAIAIIGLTAWFMFRRK